MYMYKLKLNKHRFGSTNAHFAKTTRGFTIIELLIVIVIVGVLVAITAVSYNGITKQVNQTATDVDIANMKKSLDMYMVDRTNTGELTQAEKDKIFTSFSGKNYSWNDYNNDNGQDSHFMKRGEYLMSIYGPYNYSDGTTGYNQVIVYWDWRKNKWAVMDRILNSERGESLIFDDDREYLYYYNYSDDQTPCNEQYFGRCYFMPSA